MMKFPSITIIDDSVLFHALQGFTPATFKLFVYLLHRAQNYEESGCGYELEAASDISGKLKLEYHVLTESFRYLRSAGWLQAFSASIYTNVDKAPLMYRWVMLLDIKQPSAIRLHGICLVETELPNKEWSEGFLVVGDKYIPEPKAKKRKRNGKHWQSIRKATLERDENKCTECGAVESLHVHHLTYENQGEELLEDLITLCASCHGKRKDKVVSSGRENRQT